MRIIAIVLAAVLLAGCAGGRKDLTVNYHEKFEYAVEEGYETVYRGLLADVRREYMTTTLGSHRVLENDLYPDSQCAMIRVAQINELFGECLPARLDITGTTGNTCSIAAYSSKDGLSKSLTQRQFEGWLSWHGWPYSATRSN